MTTIMLLSVAIVGLVMLAMAVGAMFSNRCLRGSCGGPDVLGPDGQSLSCETCPLRRRGAQHGDGAEDRDGGASQQIRSPGR